MESYRKHSAVGKKRDSKRTGSWKILGSPRNSKAVARKTGTKREKKVYLKETGVAEKVRVCQRSWNDLKSI